MCSLLHFILFEEQLNVQYSTEYLNVAFIITMQQIEINCKNWLSNCLVAITVKYALYILFLGSKGTYLLDSKNQVHFSLH